MTTSIAVEKASIDAGLTARYDSLRAMLRGYLADGLLIAFSGGVDSAFLVWAAEQVRRESGGKLLALKTSSASLSMAERSDVEKVVAEYGFEHAWSESREFDSEEYLKNDASRCYHCKSELFRICGQVAKDRGLRTIAYGYNASDMGDTRPGHRAAIENGIVSPLADAGLTKDDIRQLMRMNSIDLADKPASPCLSSRLVTGVAITSEKLRAVDELESLLHQRGLSVFRVRVHETNGSRFARLEVAPDEMDLAFALRREFSEAAKRLGFRWATLDLDGYKTGGGNASA
ncbi:MAG TPA: ATP-dependent sacrificial sulfur transferase LarE [Pyrinomonadaceae bacterium]|nr:ATP-dependent sacrificial sulfur transferase LarE [Pyrinomonadaceae bacterium]